MRAITGCGDYGDLHVIWLLSKLWMSRRVPQFMGYGEGSIPFTKPCLYPFQMNQVGGNICSFLRGEGSVLFIRCKNSSIRMASNLNWNSLPWIRVNSSGRYPLIDPPLERDHPILDSCPHHDSERLGAHPVHLPLQIVQSPEKVGPIPPP